MSRRAERRESSRRVRLMVRREVRERLQQRAFRITLVLGSVIAAAAIVVPTLINDDATAPAATRVAVAAPGLSAPEQAVALRELRVAARDVAPELSFVASSPSTIRREVADADADLGVVVEGGGAAADLRYRVLQSGGAVDAAPLAAALRQATLRGRAALLPAGTQRELLAPVEITIVPVGDGGEATALAVTLLSALLYLAGIMLTTQFANGLVNERSGRVTERLLTAVRPHEHLAGKLLGVGASGGLQIGTWLLAATAAGVAVSDELQATFRGVPAEMLVFFVVAVVQTYVLYAALAALLALPVRKIEDVGGAMAGVMVLQMAALFINIGVVGAGTPASSTITALSLVPPLTPLVMLSRLAVETVPAWQLAIAVVGPFLMAWGVLRLVGPAYARHAIDAPGGKGLKAALAAVRAPR